MPGFAGPAGIAGHRSRLERGNPHPLEAWSLRLVWEFLPLSNFHLIAQSRERASLQEKERSLIAKLNWVLPL
jgi:hypothetical protein